MNQTSSNEPKAGLYRARAIKGSEQYGESSGGTPELLLDFNLPELNLKRTVPLYFSQAAAPYSFERLRACGWQGSDLSDLTGVDKNEVQLRLDYETFEGKTRAKWQIESGGGRFTSSKPTDAKSFAAKVAAVTGLPVAGSGGNVPKPTF